MASMPSKVRLDTSLSMLARAVIGIPNVYFSSEDSDLMILLLYQLSNDLSCNICDF